MATNSESNSEEPLRKRAKITTSFSLSDSSSLRKIARIKAESIDYFDSVKSDIDCEVQILLSKLEKEAKDAAEMESFKSKKEELLQLNMKLLNKIDSLYDANAIKLNEYLNGSNEDDSSKDTEAIKEMTFNGYCCYISNENLHEMYKENNPIGLLILSDWYLDQNQLNFIKLVFDLMMNTI